MKTTGLGKWQFVSFLSRGSAVILGLIQSFLILRILTKAEWGTVQLVVSIGAALGIYQHLGLASASTREIASAKSDKDVLKVFVSSVFIRYLITLPLAVGLFIYADTIAVSIYKNSALILPLKIYAVTMLVQGFQSIFNSVISGTKRFKQLFTYQVVVAFLNMVIFLPLVYFYKIDGYFWAYFIFNIINSVILGVVAFYPLKSNLTLPSKKDFFGMFREIFSISVAIYIVKILSTNWEKLGPNLLGISNSAEIIAVFAFAMLYSKKILNISDAVTDVNLPVLSEKFKEDTQSFKSIFKDNFDKIFSFIILSSVTASYWAPQIIDVLVGDKYSESYRYIPLVLLAFVVYAFLDIVKSSIFVPAKNTYSMVLTYLLLMVATLLSFKLSLFYYEPLFAMSLSMAAGTIFAYLASIIFIRMNLNYDFFSYKHWIILIQSFVIGWAGIYLTFIYKAIIFPVVIGLIIYALILAKFVNETDLMLLTKIWKKRK